MDWIDESRKAREIEGNVKHGPIHPRTDPRCFRKEMIEELLDALNYCQWSYEKGEINRFQFRRIDEGLRNTIRAVEIACSDYWWWKIEAGLQTPAQTGTPGGQAGRRI